MHLNKVSVLEMISFEFKLSKLFTLGQIINNLIVICMIFDLEKYKKMLNSRNFQGD